MLSFSREARLAIAVAVAALVPLVEGCRDQEQPRTESVETAMSALSGDASTDAGKDAGAGGAPASPSIGSFALYSTQSVLLNANSLVTGCGVGVEFANGPYLSGGVAAYLNSGSTIQSTQTLYADSVYLNGGTTTGPIDTNHLTTNGASTHGAVATFPAMPAAPTAPAATAGTTSITVNTGTRVLSPGAYGTVLVNGGATLQLSGGSYVFSSVTLNGNSTLTVSAASSLSITGNAIFNGGSTLGPAAGSGLTAKSLVLYFNSAQQVTLNGNSAVHALVIAPKSEVIVNTSQFFGAISATQIVMNAGSVVTCQDSFASMGCPSSCDDSNACTVDLCSAGACVHTPVSSGTACNDGNACTQSDTCQAGTCAGASPVVCAAPDQCHTAGTCNTSTGQCSNPVATNGTTCNDGNACTQSDTCQAGACSGANPIVCAAPDQCHSAGNCNSTTGQCSNPALANGTTCNDGNACTQTDTCQAGACTGASPVVCTASDQCHSAGSCNSATGQCTNPIASNGTSCNDGNACTKTDVCASGTCGGASYTCTPTDCQSASTCDGAGGCSPTKKADGASCTADALTCTSDVCQSGACAHPIQANSCIFGNACVAAGTVNPANGCQACDPTQSTSAWSTRANGSTCNDGNACTQTDTCQAGTCTGANLVTCAAPDQCHTAGTCDSTTGHCSNPIASDGTSCNDGNACTKTDVCTGGTCGGASYTCTPTDCQSASTCDGAGGCSPTAKADGAACTADALSCTADVCQSGACAHPVQANSCIIGSACVAAGTVNPANSCQACDPAQSTSAWSVKANGTACSDGNACTQTDTCQAGTCTGANPVTCAAPDQCHSGGTCNTTTGQCSSPALPNGTTCSDGNACTQTDTCQSGTCTGASTITCAAADQCHAAGTCDPTSGVCSSPAIPDGKPCNDGSLCTTKDVCTAGTCGGLAITCSATDQCHAAGTCDGATGKCSNPIAANGTSCNDSNACTSNDVCTSGTCGGAAYTCAANECQTSSTCDGAGGCSASNKSDGTSCSSDSIACTSDICQSGACAHPLQAGTCVIGGACVSAGAANPANSCQTCDPARSTSAWSATSDGSACSDGNACTQTDVCHAGTCTGSNPVTCAAGDACHAAGTCNTSTGQCSSPVAAADGTSCSDGDACTQGDTCKSGTCSGAAVTCAAADACHAAGTCDAATGQCVNPALPDGTGCVGADKCNQSYTCTAGACIGSNRVTCTASDQCHAAGTCDPGSGSCSNPALANGTTCDDNNACTQTDTCRAGACTGNNPITCARLDACHVGGACNPSTGTCSNPVAPNGTTCASDAGVDQVCNAGACVPPDTTCAASQTVCKGICTPIQSDPANCGACGNACAKGSSCVTGTCISPQVMASCGLPTGSMSVLPGTYGVSAYVPSGNWDGGPTGIQRVVLEGGATVPPVIPTRDVVNSCASNWVTGETVCTSNGTDIYILKGDAITATLTSAATVATPFSGGFCKTCGVAIDAAHNRAVIQIGLGDSSYQYGGYQFLDLATKTLSPPPALGLGRTSEDIAIDPVRQMIFSPNEQGNYQIIQYGGTPALFDNQTVPSIIVRGNSPTWDTAAEDCTTGIALATDEDSSDYVHGSAHLVLQDINQATFTPGSPTGQWTAPFSSPVLSGLPSEGISKLEMTGLAVAPGSHLGFIAAEGGGGVILVFQLPSTAGSGIPELVDWAVAVLNGDFGSDPHNVTAYTSPRTGRPMGVVANGGRSQVQTIDLQAILDAPRTAGSHNVDSSYDLVGRGAITIIPLACAQARTLSDVNNCGACGNVCAAAPNSEPTCVSGACTLLCAPNTSDCNGDYSDGCESILITDAANCGACGRSCAAPNATGLCSNGQCFAQCASGFSDCDGRASNGCETQGTCAPLTLSASGPTNVAVGASATYTAQVTEPVPGRTVAYAWSVASGPGKVTFSMPGASTTDAAFAAPGTYVLQIEVSDGFGAVIGSLTVNAAYVNTPPVVSVGSDQTLTAPAMTAQLSGTATDDGLPLRGTLSAAWSLASGPAQVSMATPTVSGVAEPGPLHAATAVTFVYPGTYVFQLTVSDSNLTSSATQTVTVNPPVAIGATGGSGGVAPVISIDGITDDQEITQPTPITATISDGTWLLEQRLGGRDDVETPWTIAASGTGPVSGTTITTFDPTLLLNGIYTLRLSSTNSAGSTSISDSITVDGRMKIGNFTLAFNDLTTSVGVLPLTITRTYDSRDKRVGDFGVGWRLGISNVRVEKSGKVGAYWEQQFTDQVVFTQFCLFPTRAASVAFTFPSGRQYRFVPQASPQCVRGSADTAPDIVWVSTSDPKNPTIQLAETGSSAFTGSAVITNDIGNGVTELDTANGDIWDPRRFTLTIEDGSVWTIDQDGGVSKVTDRNGNYVEVTPNGILHSSGTQVPFTRDAQNRITTITDPNGKAMAYHYDGNGDLAMYTDRAANVTQFSYGTKHDLLEIQDPLGRRAIRNAYDDSGRLLSTTDALGNTAQYTANLAANQEQVTDRLGHVTTYSYNERGDITQKVDATGAVWGYTLDLRGNELTQTDPLGNVTTTTYDGADNVLTRTDALGNTTTNTYDPFRNLRTATDPLGRTTVYTYDGSGNRESTMDPLGNISRSTYDTQGNLLTQVDPIGNLTRYEYDGAGHVLRQYDANIMARSDWFNHATTFTYDADGNKKSESMTRTTFNGSGGEVDTTYTYDAVGRRTGSAKNAPGSQTMALSTTYTATGKQETTTDADGRVTTYHYDALDRLASTTLPDGTSTSQTYDAENRRVSSTDAAGNTTLYAYDAVGRLIRTTFADGTSQSTGYDSAGRAVQTVDALGYVTWTAYDAAGRVTTTTDPTGAVTRHEYDAAGNQTRVIDALGNTTTLAYDDDNRAVATTYADGTADATEYDAAGRAITKIDTLGRSTRFGYDRLGALIQVTDALGNVTQYRYDETGARLAITDGKSHVTGFAYDFATGVQISRGLPDGHSDHEIIDAAGLVTRHIDFAGQRINFTRDALGRVLTRSYPDGASVGFTYTPTGQRATMTDARGTTFYGYDVRNRLVLLTYPDGRQLAYGYDARGERTTVTAKLGPRALTTTTSYDAVGRIHVVTDPLGRTYIEGYDSTGNRTQLAYPNTTTTTYDYDVNHRLKQLTTTQRAGVQPPVTVQAYAYTLDAAGKRTVIAEGDGTLRKYGYDGIDRLTSETVTGSLAYTNTFVYDAVGNRATPETLATVGYDTRDRLTFDGVASYTYDDNGNVLSKSGEATYGWDFDNRLTSVTMADGTVVAHTYDADGNRVQTAVTPPGGGTAAITNMLVDTSGRLSQVVAETDASSNLTALYVRAGDELLAVMRPGGGGGMWTTHFVHADGLGSVRAITDEGGTVVDTRGYEAFGTKNVEAGSEILAYGFAGEPLDSTTHLAYHRARWMDSRVGRFEGVDPADGCAAPGCTNRYAYVSGSPVDNVDPTGQFDMISISVSISIVGSQATLPGPNLGRALIQAARSGGLGSDKIINLGCFRQADATCNPTVLANQLGTAFWYLSFSPKGRELIGRIRNVSVRQVDTSRGDEDSTDQSGEIINWDPFGAIGVTPTRTMTMMPGGFIQTSTRDDSVLSPALGLAHELAHTLGLKDSDPTGGPVPAWEAPIARQLRGMGFGEGLRTQYGAIRFFHVASSIDTGPVH